MGAAPADSKAARGNAARTAAPAARRAGSMARRFAAAMRRFEPFEPAPHIALAVSGGPDSVALALIADEWSGERGGTVTALTVDHGLRKESRGEALWVKRTLAARGIRHRILTWGDGPKTPRANLQARAREARYRLLEDWCRRQGVLHLLTAHHLDDQAETFVMRAARGSGPHGLAAMAAVSEHIHMRLLRPLLGIRRRTLRSYLEGRGQDWIDDPSNEDEDFARVRTRRAMPGLDAAGLTSPRIADTAARLGRDRARTDRAVARLLARIADPDPAGFVRLRRDGLAAAPAEVGMRALAGVLMAVGGGRYAPRWARLQRLYEEILGQGRGRTLGGCTIRPVGGEVLLISREPAAQAAPLVIGGSGSFRWDGRFLVRLSFARGGAEGTGLTLGALGREGWAGIKSDAEGFPAAGRLALPAAVRATLPAVRDRRGVLAVPHLGYRRSRGAAANLIEVAARPFPPQPLAGPEFRAPGR